MKDKICIIGMTGVYPKCQDTDTLWKALLSQETLSDNEECTQSANNFVSTYYKVDDTEYFDHELFAYTPHECEVMDPQQRVALECAYRLMEETGYVNGEQGNTIGVFMSGSMSSYLLNNVYKNSRFDTEELNYNVLIGNDKDFLATRIAYKMNLTGPAATVQCACSSSLVSLNTAINSIESGQCNMAIVGGVSIQFPTGRGYLYKEGGIMSRTGTCRPFDEKADGTIKGNGCSVIMIKKLEDAMRDNDTILAVIDGIGVNNDGTKKIGFTAPSIEGQKEVLKQALNDASLSPDDMDYIETHGTGTPLGDPIEIRAISETYQSRTKEDKIYLGSIKANVGHMDAAAGITSVIKTIYMLQNNVVPAIKNFSKMNPSIEKFSEHLCYPTENTSKDIHTVGISSFGLGGTNGHVILSKYDKPASKQHDLDYYAVPVSYLRENDYEKYAKNIELFLGNANDLPSALYSICLSQKRFANNVTIVCSSKEDFLYKLNNKIFVDNVNNKALSAPGFELSEFVTLEKQLLSFASFCNTYRNNTNKETMELSDYETVFREYINALGITNSRKCKIVYQSMEGSQTTNTVNPVETFMEFIASANNYFSINWKLLYKEQNFTLLRGIHYPMEKTKFFIMPDEQKEKKVVQTNQVITLDAMIALWEEILGIENIKSQDDFFDLGGDSMIAIDILDELEQQYSTKMSMKDFMNHSTPELLYSFINANTTKESCLSKIKSGNPNLNLFLIHAAGGGTFEYKDMARLLHSDFTVYAIDLPEDYQTSATMKELAARYLHDIEEIQPSGFYYIGGHSFGGNLAFEMGLQLQEKGKQSELILFDSHTPLAYVDKTGGEIDYNHVFEDITDAYVDNKDGSQALTSKLNGQKVEQFYGKWIYNHKLLKEYNNSTIYNGNIIFYQALERENPVILESLHITEIPKDNWKNYCSGEFVKYEANGNHYTMFSNKEYRNQLATQLDQYLSQKERNVN